VAPIKNYNTDNESFYRLAQSDADNSLRYVVGCSWMSCQFLSSKLLEASPIALYLPCGWDQDAAQDGLDLPSTEQQIIEKAAPIFEIVFDIPIKHLFFGEFLGLLGRIIGQQT